MVKTLPIKHKIIIGLNTIKQNNLLWRYPSLFLSESFSGYLQGNLLWRYLNEMFTEHMRGTGAVFPQSFEGKKRRIEPPRLEPECSNPSVELVGSTNPPSENGNEARSSPDPENISTHPLPRENPTQMETEKHSSRSALTGKRKSHRDHKLKEKGHLHSKERRYQNDGPLHRRALRFEVKRRIGVRRKVQLNVLSQDGPPRTNFTTVSPFEREGLSDLRDNDLEAIPAEMLSATGGGEESTLPDLQHIKDPKIRKLAQDLCKEYPDLFRKTVSSMEAQVQPFSLHVDHEKWRTKGNRLPPRRMDNTRESELRRQIELLLRLGVIRESKAGHYSHAFVVPKPGDKWRLVLDFKNLNKVSEVESGWGIPNIQDIMKRLGSHRPRYFTGMDLTAGFHQTPIAEESREFTAFKTPWGGLYEWCRLPMGLKGAPAYFQGAMATEVLGGLIMNICELYLDDVIVYAETASELGSRLRRCFERFQEKGITLNPSKCKLFVPSVEYCGHLIDSEGLHFTPSKLEGVTDFPVPETQQGLRSFLGLANWFREHVGDHS